MSEVAEERQGQFGEAAERSIEVVLVSKSKIRKNLSFDLKSHRVWIAKDTVKRRRRVTAKVNARSAFGAGESKAVLKAKVSAKMLS